MVRIAIIEGPDKIGKTTLIKLMKELYPSLHVRKLIRPYELSSEMCTEWAQGEVSTWKWLGERTWLLYDRFPFPSDIAYRENKDMTQNQNEWTRLMKSHEVRFLHLSPADRSEYIRRLSETLSGNHPMSKSEFSRGVLDRYSKWMRESARLGVLVYPMYLGEDRLPDARHAGLALEILFQRDGEFMEVAANG